MTPQPQNAAALAGLRCPVCAGALSLNPAARVLRCPAGHSFDLAREGYANLLAINRRHAADPGDSKEMVQARHRFLEAGYYRPFMVALAGLCKQYAPTGRPAHLVDAGCGEGSYAAAVYVALAAAGTPPAVVGFDLSRQAVRLAAKRLPAGAFCVGGSFAAPVRDGWADILLNIFSPFAGDEFLRMLRPGGVLLYAVPTARHLFGLKQVLYATPYENPERDTLYKGFTLLGGTSITDTVCIPAGQLQDLFAMTPYYWKTPADGAARLAALPALQTEIGFRFLAYQKQE
ncbi:MAG: methyltransferase [Gemmiger sp.]|nr:methyltransferase [Gemmiger sp.]